MPRPNKSRGVFAEANLAQRVAHERVARTWSPEGLAVRMAGVGCPINVSAIYRIEQADPPRRITVDELVGFSRVFAIPVEELLLPAAVALERVLVDRLVGWEVAETALQAATTRRDEAFELVSSYVQDHPELKDGLTQSIMKASSHSHENPKLHAAFTLWELTHDQKYANEVQSMLNTAEKDDDRG